jgi:hypothetical protein
MSDSSFDFNLFLKDSIDVLVNPKSYFSTMKTSGGMSEPLIKAVIYGAISGALAFIWSLLRIGAMTGGWFGGTIGIMIFIWSIIGAIIGLFIGAVILLVISSICKGSTDFEACLRVTASVMAVWPIRSFFGFAGHFNIYLGVIVALIIGIYSLWLIYNGLVEALKSNPETSKIVCYVLVALIVLFTLIGFGTARRARRFMNEFNSRDMKEMMKDNPKDK